MEEAVSRLQSQVIEAMCALLLPLGGGLLLGAGALLHIDRGGTGWWLIVPILAVPLGAWWRRWWERRYAGVIAALGGSIVDDQCECLPDEGLRVKGYDR